MMFLSANNAKYVDNKPKQTAVDLDVNSHLCELVYMAAFVECNPYMINKPWLKN